MCWNHMVDGSWPRATRRREPMRAPAADVRVSDSERDEVVQRLSRHTGEGRLTIDEFEERVEQVYASKTRRELDATLRGLPRPAVRVSRRVDVADRLRPLVGIAVDGASQVTPIHPLPLKTGMFLLGSHGELSVGKMTSAAIIR